MTNIWVGTDLHIFNYSPDERHPHRSISNIDRVKQNYAADIDSGDLFIYLGDLCDPGSADIPYLKEMLGAILGHKVMCKGNHDTETDAFYLDLGFDKVCTVAQIHSVLFSHKPLDPSELPPDMINVHGHLHTQQMSGLDYRYINAYDPQHKDHPFLLDSLIDNALQTKPQDTITTVSKMPDKSQFTTAGTLLDLSDKVQLIPMDESTDENTFVVQDLNGVNTPDALLDWMKKNVRYANFTKLKTDIQVIKSKSGSCHDQVAFAYPRLRKMGKSAKVLFFISYREGEETGGMTHSLVYWEEDGKTFWFENAWQGAQGIRKYDSLDELKKDIIARYKRMPSSQTFPELDFKTTSISKFKAGVSLSDLVDSVYGEESPANETADRIADMEIFTNVDLSDEDMERVVYMTTYSRNMLGCYGFTEMSVIITDEPASPEASPEPSLYVGTVMLTGGQIQLRRYDSTRIDWSRIDYAKLISMLVVFYLVDQASPGVDPINRQCYAIWSIPGCRYMLDTAGVKFTEAENTTFANILGMVWTNGEEAPTQWILSQAATADMLVEGTELSALDEVIFDSPEDAEYWMNDDDYEPGHKKEEPRSDGIGDTINESAIVKTPKVLYHGSPNKHTVLKAQAAQAFPDTVAVYGTPSYEFALAYAGDTWNDLQINQSVYNGQYILTEILPGQFQELFGQPGYIHYMKPDDFAPFGGSFSRSMEYVCPHDVTPYKIEKLPNVLTAIKNSNTKLYWFPDLPPFISDRIAYIRRICDRWDMDANKIIKRYNLSETSMATTIDKDHKQKETISLNVLKRIVIDEAKRKELSNEYKFMKHFYGNDNWHQTIGWLDKDGKLVAAICVSKPDAKYADQIWLSDFEIVKEYRGHGLSKQIVDYACKNCGVDALGVAHDNKIARKVYEDYGFKYGKDVHKQDKAGTNRLMYLPETASLTEAAGKSSNIWYHMVPKGTDMSAGICSLRYMRDHRMVGPLKDGADKYRNRLVSVWNIYPDRDPESLTVDEILSGLVKFRGGEGDKSIYLFKYPPTAELGPNMAAVIEGKDIYEVDLGKVPDLRSIDYTVNDGPGKAYYNRVQPTEYFSTYDDDAEKHGKLLFAGIPHVSVQTKSGRIPPTAIQLIRNDREHTITAKATPSINPNDPVSSKAVDIAFYDGKHKIGEASASSIDTDTAFLYNVEVFPAYRGKGYGNSIMEYMLSLYPITELTVEKSNKVAISLYEKFGFKIDKPFKENGKQMLDMKRNQVMTEAVRRPHKKTTRRSELVFLSPDSDWDESVIKPRIPDNYMTKNRFEDNRTPRVCFSTSISKALRALSQKCTGMELYVYVPGSDKYKVVTPTKQQVPDVDITDEKWILEPVVLYSVGKIRVLGDAGQPGLPYTYGNGQTAELYDWNWEWVYHDDGDPCGGSIITVNEAAAETHAMDREEQNRLASKYDLHMPGHTEEEQEAPKKKKTDAQIRAEERREKRKKDLEKARRIKKRKAFVRKVKSKLPFQKKNEDAAGANDQAISYDSPDFEKTVFGERIRFFGDVNSIENESINESYQFQLDDPNLRFMGSLTEASATDDTKLYPVYIMLIHSGTLLATAIKAVTNSKFSHSSISFDSSMRNMYSFGRKFDANPFIGAFKKEDITDEFYKNRQIPYALYMVPCTAGEIELMKKRLNYFIQNTTKFKYDFTGLMKNYFGIADNPEYKWFCSRFVADIINAGAPSEHPYVMEPSLMKPEDFRKTNFATYVTGGYLETYDKKVVDRLTNKILRTEKIRRAKQKALDQVLDVNPFDPLQETVLGYHLSMMDESAVDVFFDYMRSFKVKFDKDGNVIITRREYDQLDSHFRGSLKMIKAYEKTDNLVGVKDELCKIKYMIELINIHYLDQRTKSSDRVKTDLRKQMMDLRSVMLNAFQQHLKYVTVRDPQFNMQQYYNASNYGTDTVIPKAVITSIGKTLVTKLS